MGGKEPWPKRLLALFQDQPRLPVEPRHRISGPALVPSDWWNRPELVLPQCNLCHQRPLPGSDEPLVRGLCGPCRKNLDETPTAA